MRHGLLVMMVGACAAGPPRQYTLKIDAADQSKTQLCERNANEDAAKAPTCKAFGAQSLHTPSTLTVKVDNQAPGAKYDLRIAQFSREASKADAEAIVAETAQRIAAFAGAAAPGTDASEAIGTAAKNVVDRAPRVAAAVEAPPPAAESPAAPSPALDLATRFPMAGGKLQSAAELRKASNLTMQNAPGNPPPFPRADTITDADLQALAALKITVDDVAVVVADWCHADSFTPAGSNWTAVYAALRKPPDANDVSALRTRLAPSREGIARYLASQGGVDPMASVIEPLIDAGDRWAAAPTAAPDPAARSYYLMRLAKAIQPNVARCRANLAVLKAAKPGATAAGKLDAATTSLDGLQASLEPHAATFDAVFGPTIERSLVLSERSIDVGLGSTTITLEPGKLELGLGTTPADGKRAEIATYKVKANGIERLAVLFAPTFTVCTWHCFDQFETTAVAATDNTAAHTEITRSEPSYDLSVVTALHVTTYAWEHWGLGAVLGYPLGTPRETSNNFVLGLGMRHESGVEIAVGVHGMTSKQLKSPYEDPVDLSRDGYEALSPDSVTHDVRRIGVFFLVGFAPSVLEALNK